MQYAQHHHRPPACSDYCQQAWPTAKTIAFDTEFVSEHTYRPVLCLVQVAADGELAVIDPLAVDDMTPFWEVHRRSRGTRRSSTPAAARSSSACMRSAGVPAGLFDVQIAAGLVGHRVSGRLRHADRASARRTPAKKHETRTDWRRRPLSQRQIEYALDDVRYLPPMRDTLHARLAELGRLEWLAEEMAAGWRRSQRAMSQERWRRVSGNAGLDGRAWRSSASCGAGARPRPSAATSPSRRVLRDDLIVELAKRQTADPKRIRAVRGLERGDLATPSTRLPRASSAALAMPEQECPRRGRRESMPQLSVLGQFLFAALGSICRQAELAPNLVGTPNDIRELIAYRTRRHRQRPSAAATRPRLACRSSSAACSTTSWPAAIAIRVGDPSSDHPLVLEPVAGGTLEVEGVRSQETGVRSQEPGARRKKTARGQRKRGGGTRKTGDRRQKSDDKPV